ncbi:MAG TPA: SepM family pheromone-processing serine protease [Bacillus sp. (in: firmicutes)]|nr:SepM family pheromone-processing serine protease [Bacillus sp. (in: firmicutes)]
MKSKMNMAALSCGIILALILSFYPLPYYITKPGMAQELSPIIEVEGGYEEKGSLMLTTVRMGKATPLAYALAHIQDFQEIYPVEDIRQEGESDEDYTYRQLHMMETSKESAISVAYRHAGKEVIFKNHGVYVMSIIPSMPAEEVLKVGDRVYKVDGKEIETSEQFVSYVTNKKVGDKVNIEFERDGKNQKAAIAIAPFPQLKGKAGLGITLLTDREIIVEPDVKMDTEKIGGPSAGLMFSLEIYNQLTREDITNGYEIAGTGTIDDEGRVGRIGGISQKVVAAANSGAEIFLAPNEEGVKGSNYREALAAAKKIDTKMKIVPVDTFDEAVQYLKTLKP